VCPVHCKRTSTHNDQQIVIFRLGPRSSDHYHYVSTRVLSPRCLIYPPEHVAEKRVFHINGFVTSISCFCIDNEILNIEKIILDVVLLVVLLHIVLTIFILIIFIISMQINSVPLSLCIKTLFLREYYRFCESWPGSIYNFLLLRLSCKTHFFIVINLRKLIKDKGIKFNLHIYNIAQFSIYKTAIFRILIHCRTI